MGACPNLGGKDSLGLPHGRGTQRYSSGDVFRGHFHHGERDGRGSFCFEDGRYGELKSSKPGACVIILVLK